MSALSSETLYIIQHRDGAEASAPPLDTRLAGRAGVVIVDRNEDGAVLAVLSDDARLALSVEFPDLLIERDVQFAPCDQ